MASISSFMISESSQNIPAPNGHGNIIQQIIGPTIVLRPQYIPGNFSFSVFIGVCDLNLKERNTMQLILKTPQGELLEDLGTNDLPVFDKEDCLPQKYSGFVVGLDLRNINVAQEGCYKLEVFINGSQIGAKDIPIYRRMM